jgi:rubrerythrin
VDAYIKARDIEKKSQEFYQQKAEELDDPEQQKICLQIAKEEGQHYIILDNLIELLQRPATWVEDAEWRNMEDY